MSDFVERLRKEIKFSQPHNTVHIDLLGEAADRIEALETQLLVYANHLSSCGYFKGHDCDCGLDEIRTALAPEQDK
jgi:hypothetical protein